ncbi:anhydro-N-acetylmuramic acid kinase [Actinobacteria bacterium YIM 96077]|uniref:Anhydro-N-acetylmuramic acid kinase n=1 Tax=Phytoactinopolyspora halophila TaxID=1981511 RepID=A0A329QES7_9ACTN|nr:anhydro-N-acetylmuramic acid kinase [Actinobacteria bacterium YIM 96077]RAW10877.1 anhydro-N-acetylmuramic acid kinase [Phytoactinopolyspora halophila]
MRVLGMISGTSHDGIDVAVVEFDLEDGTNGAGHGEGEGVLHGNVLYTTSHAYDASLRSRLRESLPPSEPGFAEMCELDTSIGQAFAAAAADAADVAGPLDLICSHGQTVYHWVEGTRARGTLQIGQPAWIAERTGVPVLSDVRGRDIAAGGHGAPLVPLLDVLLLAGVPGRPAALNLGGIANITVPGGTGSRPVAYDVGPANALIDAAALLAEPDGPGYDAGGALGAAGTVHDDLLEDLLAEPYYALSPPKSTGKELFHDAYLARMLARYPDVGYSDVVATVTALTARTVARAARGHGVDTLVVSGGGWHNPVLRSLLDAEIPEVTLRPSSELGAPVDAKEAIAFALIGWHSWFGLAGTVPACTGAVRPVILGSFTPGETPLTLPEPRTAAPSVLYLGDGISRSRGRR